MSRPLEPDWSVVEENFVRASGPGGQHVNKTATAVQLRYDLRRARPPLSRPVHERLRKLAGSRLSRDDVLILECSEHRSQEQNRRQVRERLVGLLAKAAQKPKPRIPTRPGLGAKRRRLDAKKKRAGKKSLRRRPID
ncbi:aminoacyl-tRNA hydrolase [Methylonatrum kenyense]|uniref:alternative ribosome rescue aminoacyl-tRNA hydrolase ArfB n=1 Tax=Methylonatrum kenyense TaxID=455253 RepID=UPI0020BE6B62|nr:alternative ribosome rescue aminoacyl-tRNA hydrolase ArfB [Methylonatrum kenyense]MCK8515684.1 aminoacyl-tRNA hydrolase [Methylonatrum kenyense]